MSQPKAKILIVDDSQQELRIHATTLRSHGYEVVTASGGEEALFLVEAGVPDLFLIDTSMQDMDGYVLCERLKEDNRLLNVPVIFITSSSGPETIDRAYAVGGVDYIVKPCHLSEFLAKVRTHISLYHLLLEVQQLREAAIDANPLTHLPGNNSIVKTIQDALDQRQDLAVLYSDLDNFKSYNDVYGFSAGDAVLLFCAEVLKTALTTLCHGEGFLGHIGGDDFVAMAAPEKSERICLGTVRCFKRVVRKYYCDEDWCRGSVRAAGRDGNVLDYPLVSISLGILDVTTTMDIKEIGARAAHLKKYAKSIPGNAYVRDRRSQPDPACATE